jgi:hypothetical protein
VNGLVLVENFVDGVVDTVYVESGLAIDVARDRESSEATRVVFPLATSDEEGECYVLAITTVLGNTAPLEPWVGRTTGFPK